MKKEKDFKNLVIGGIIVIFLISALGNCNGCSSKNEAQKISKVLLKEIVQKDSIIFNLHDYIVSLEKYNAAVEAENTILKSQMDKNSAALLKSLERPTNVNVRVPEQKIEEK